MMERVKIDFQEALNKIEANCQAYVPAAYRFLYMAANPYIDTPEQDEKNNVTLPKYYQSIVDNALEVYGPLAFTVFCHWGLKSNADISSAVQHLVDVGLLSLTGDEKLSDLTLYPSIEYFLEDPFLPTNKE